MSVCTLRLAARALGATVCNANAFHTSTCSMFSMLSLSLSQSFSLSLTLCQSVALTLYLTIALTFSVTVSHSHSHSLAPLTRHTFAQSTLNPRSGRAVSGSALHLLAYEYIVRAHCGIHINKVSAIKVPPFDNQHNE